MCGEAGIGGRGGPAVVQYADPGAVHRHHGFYRQYQTRPEPGPRARASEIGYLRWLVHLTADAVTDELPDDPEACCLDDVLNGRGNITKAVADHALFEAGPEGSLGCADQLTGGTGNLTGRVSHRLIGDVTPVDGREVDRQSISFREHLRARNTVHHIFVHGSVQRPGEAPVALESRASASGEYSILSDGIELPILNPGSEALSHLLIAKPIPVTAFDKTIRPDRTIKNQTKTLRMSSPPC